jgi:hypothetical protein
VLAWCSRIPSRRLGWLVFVSLAIASTWLGYGCDGGAGSGSRGGAGGDPSSTGEHGVGEPCSQDRDCRTGLVCDRRGVCEPGHATPEGEPCQINDECAEGLYCDHTGDPGTCAPAGSGTEGSACGSNAECAPGFRCNLVNFGAKCEAQGSADVGQPCAKSDDCLGGLLCVVGACIAVPKFPFVPPSWPGVTPEECDDHPETTEAYFSVPRIGKKQDFFRLPFPNDVRASSGALDLSGFPTPGPDYLGYDVVKRYVEALSSDFHGFGVYDSVIFRFSGPLDRESFDGAVQWVDLNTSETLTYRLKYYLPGGNYVCPNWFAVRPAQGSTLAPGHRYAVYLTTKIKAEGGGPILASAELKSLLSPAVPADPDLAAHWHKYQTFRDHLVFNGIDATTIINATVFTVGDPTTTLRNLSTTIAFSAPPFVGGWTLCDGQNLSPCPDASGDRACPTSVDPDFHEIHALVQLPIYQSGIAPYRRPDDGGGFVLDPSGTPLVQAASNVCLSLTIPKTAPPSQLQTVVFAHGIGGNFRSHVELGIAKAFARGVFDGQFNKVKAAVIGIDQVQHGPRSNGATASPHDLFYNWANPAAARGNAQQSAADQLSVGRLVPFVQLDAATSPTGEAIQLSSLMAFFGHSQSASAGALMLPHSPYQGAVLASQGAGVMNTLVTRTGPVNVAAAIPYVLHDVDPFTGRLFGAHDPLNPNDVDQNNPALGLIQLFMNPADPISYAHAIAREPPAGVLPHALFQVFGQSDTYTPSLPQATFALAARIGLVVPDASVAVPDPIGTLTTLATPARGNLLVDGQPVTGLVRQYAPIAGGDGHDVVFQRPSARRDAFRFLAGVLSGVDPQVGPP